MNFSRLATLTLALAVAVFALSYNPSFADNPKKGDCDPKHCDHGGDDGGGGGGLEGVTYTVQLTTGLFPTVLVYVTPNDKENTLFPDPDTDDLVFVRPGGDVIPDDQTVCDRDDGEINTNTACMHWTTLFDDCDSLRMAGVDVPSFTVSADNYSIGRPGGIQVALGGIEVLDAFPDGDPFVGLHLTLSGECFGDDGCTAKFVPVPIMDNISVTEIVPLTRSWLIGHTVKGIKPRGHCNKEGRTPGLATTINLEITAAKCTGGASLQGQESRGMTPDCAPTVTVDSLTTINNTPELNGTVTDSAVTISVNVDNKDYPANDNGDDTWTLAGGTIDPVLVVGTYEVTVTATDAEGDVGTDDTTLELVITAPPP